MAKFSELNNFEGYTKKPFIRGADLVATLRTFSINSTRTEEINGKPVIHFDITLTPIAGQGADNKSSARFDKEDYITNLDNEDYILTLGVTKARRDLASKLAALQRVNPSECIEGCKLCWDVYEGVEYLRFTSA